MPERRQRRRRRACRRAEEKGASAPSARTKTEIYRFTRSSLRVRLDTLRIWDVENGKEVKTLRGHTKTILSIAISPDRTKIVSGSVDSTVRIWDFESGEMLRTLEGHTDWVQSVAFSPNGETVVSGSDDRTIRVWIVESGEVLQTVKEHPHWRANSVVFLPDGKRVVSGHDDCQIRVWDVDNGNTLRILHGHTEGVCHLVLSPDGRRIASRSMDGTMRMWDIEDDESVAAVRTLLVHHPSPVTLPNHSESLPKNALWDGTDSLSAFTSSWIIGPDKRLLFWVPLHLRARIVNWPGCRAIWGREGDLYLDFSRFKCGTEWAQCAGQSVL